MGYLQQRISKGYLLTKEQEKILLRLYRKGDLNSRDKLFESQMPWVIRLCTKYKKKVRADLDDLIQSGMVALLRSLETFDPKKGRLSTYATRNVNWALWNYCLHKDNPIHIPEYKRKSVSFEFTNVGEDIPVTENPEISFERDEYESLEKHLKRLPKRWVQVLKGRMRGRTLEDLGNEMGVTRERIRQMEKNAIERLRQEMNPN